MDISVGLVDSVQLFLDGEVKFIHCKLEEIQTTDTTSCQERQGLLNFKEYIYVYGGCPEISY